MREAGFTGKGWRFSFVSAVPGDHLAEGRSSLRPLFPKRMAKMIIRIWHGWTTLPNADIYENLLKQEIFTGIQDRQIRGFKGIQLLRREAGEEIEFITIMRFDSLEAVQEFAGPDYEAAVVPPSARAVLAHFDGRSQHYELIEERTGE
jgi:heme-degrading monooxygenase HmoA